MRKLMFALAALIGLALLPTASFAQSQTGTQVWSNGTRNDVATGVCATGPAVNATQAAGTCTITPPSGQYVYFTYLQVAACSNGVASASSVQQNFTTTNLNAWVGETSIIGYAATTALAAPFVACDRIGGARTTPLRSAAAGTAVTIVPPAQAANFSFPIIAEYYFAP